MERTLTPLASIVRRVLFADAAVEGVVGLVLLGLVGRPHVWLDVDRRVTLIAAAVFFVATAAIAVAAVVPGTPRAFVRQVAFANVAGGVAIWGLALLDWDRFRPEGQWLIGATADAFIVVGALELIALRRTNPDI